MAVQVVRSGAALVKVDTGTSNALESLGYAEDQIEPELIAFWQDVFGDQHGGPAGPPIDVQFLGEIARIRMVLSKYDTAIMNKVKARFNPLATGTIADDAAGSVTRKVLDADIGALMIQNSKTYRVVLVTNTSVEDMNFPICFAREPILLPRGTKFTAAVLEFEAHRNQSTGVLYDTTIV